MYHHQEIRENCNRRYYKGRSNGGEKTYIQYQVRLNRDVIHAYSLFASNPSRSQKRDGRLSALFVIKSGVHALNVVIAAVTNPFIHYAQGAPGAIYKRSPICKMAFR